jgi:thioesterase domain-containing protein
VIEAGPDRVRIRAPLEPNLNHRSTAFGGSVAALAVLSGWTLVHLRLASQGLRARTVIQESTVRYDAPIHDVFDAVCEAPAAEAWARFTRTLARRGRGRVRVRASVASEGRVAASFEGAYVSLAEADA